MGNRPPLVGGMQAASLPVDEPITPVDYVSTLVGTQSKHSPVYG